MRYPLPSDGFLPDYLNEIIEGELAKGERVVWSGQPIASRLVWPSFAIVLFGIPFTAFALFWMFMARGIVGRAPNPAGGVFPVFRFLPLFGIPFLLIGLAMLSTPYWMLRKTRRTAYAVTDRRVLLVEGGLLGGINIRSLEPEQLHDVTRTQYADGSGNLVLQRQYRGVPLDPTDPRYRGVPFFQVGFYGIPDVKHVEDLVRELASKAQPAGDGRGA